MVQSIRLSVGASVRLSVSPFSLCSNHYIIMKFSGVITNDRSDVHVKGQGQRSKVKVTVSQRSKPNLKPFPDHNSSLNSHMVMKWCTQLDVISKRCPIIFQGHPSNFKVTRDKRIPNFDPNWDFPDCNSSLDSPMVLKWCTKLDVV